MNTIVIMPLANGKSGSVLGCNWTEIIHIVSMIVMSFQGLNQTQEFMEMPLTAGCERNEARCCMRFVDVYASTTNRFLAED